MSADLGPESDVGSAPDLMIFQEKKQKKKARKLFPARAYSPQKWNDCLRRRKLQERELKKKKQKRRRTGERETKMQRNTKEE